MTATMTATTIATTTATATASPSPRRAAPPARRTGSLWALLVWTYRDQRADRDDGGWDWTPPRVSGDGVAAMIRWGELECRVDGGRWKGLSGAEPHRDAQAVVARMATLPEAERRLLVRHARTGVPPERPRPHAPMPVEPSPADIAEGRVSWGLIDGERVWVRRDVAEVVVVGRDGTERTLRAPYCPLDYGVSPYDAALAEQRAAAFEAALARLAAAMRGVALTRWELTGAAEAAGPPLPTR